MCFGWFPCLIVPTLAFGLPSLLWPRPAFIAKDGSSHEGQEMTSHAAAVAAVVASEADPTDDMETVRTNTSDSVLTMQEEV